MESPLQSLRAVPVRTVGLSLSVGTRTLLRDVDVTFPEGRVSLIVGPSGAGKTMLLYALAGLLEDLPEVRLRGRILVGDRDVTVQSPRTDFGVVFQQFALFDDLTARGNVQFAIDHARTASASAADRPGTDRAESWLKLLGVPDDLPVARLSGGQQQRLAVARTLAYRPNVILYDEPTSGLDAVSAHKVARLIRQTQRDFGITSIVVTHDYDVLPAVADAVFLFDTGARTLIAVPPDRWHDLRRMLLEDGNSATRTAPRADHQQPGTPPEPPVVARQRPTDLPDARDATQEPRPPSGLGRAGHGDGQRSDRAGATAPQSPQPNPSGGSFPEPALALLPHALPAVFRHIERAAWHTGGIVMNLAALPWWLLLAWLRFVPRWRRLKWSARFFVHYARVVGGFSAHLYLAVMGFLIGFVTTYFTFEQFPYREYTRPLLIENLLQAVGFLLYRVLVPLLATVLIAARCGAAVASDLGAKSYGRQLDAMRSFGVKPPEYLLTGTLWAFLIGTPWLTLVAFWVARETSRAVFTTMFPEHGSVFWELYFHWELRSPQHLLYAGSGWLFGKLAVCALGTALIAYQLGTAPKASSGEVRSAITTTILWSTLWVLVTHFVFTFHEFRAYQGP